MITITGNYLGRFPWVAAKKLAAVSSLFVLLNLTPALAEGAVTNHVRVVNGIVQPKRPVPEAIADAMKFIKKGDGNYVPGNIKDGIPGYFTNALVKPDGTPYELRRAAYPAHQHANYILTFLHYWKYSGQREWLLRARDLADWNIIHSTPPDAFYANMPFSSYPYDKPMHGNRDKDAIEPDKDALMGSAYVALFEATNEKNYLNAAVAIADTLAKRQEADGSWPFRVVPADGTVRQEFGGAPVNFVQFFEDVQRHEKKPAYRQAHERALALMLKRNVQENLWGTYYEDVASKPKDYLTAEPMCWTADYLFRHAKGHPEYIKMGRTVLHRMEVRFVHTTGHPAAPAPGVSEQEDFPHIMPSHTARYCLVLADLYKATGDEQAKREALSGINALTYMQAPNGLFRTYFQLIDVKNPKEKFPDWYAPNLSTVLYVLEAMPILPEIGQEKGIK